MTTTFYAATLDGVTSFTHLNGGTVNWDAGWIGYVSMYNSTPNDTLDATITLDGSNWTIAALRFGAEFDNVTTITDANGNAGRRIDLLSLGYNSDVDLISTRVKYIEGWDGALHDIVLGSANTRSVNVYAAVNKITTGSGHVGAIETGGRDTVTINSGGASGISTGGQRDIIKVQNGGWVGGILAGSGNDLVAFNGANGDAVNLGDGNDVLNVVGGAQLKVALGYSGNNTVKVGNNSRLNNLELDGGSQTVNILGSGRVHSMKITNGDATINTNTQFTEEIFSWMSSNTVHIGDGGVGAMQFYGDNSLVHTVTATGHIQYMKVGDGAQTTVTLTGAAGAGTLRTDDGNDTITTDTGWVELISTRGGKDVVTIGSGGANVVRLGDGDDVIKLTEIDPDSGVNIQGGAGSDTVDFSGFSTGIVFTLESYGIWQNVGDPNGDVTAPGVVGWFQETSIENVTGTTSADTITGDFQGNVLRGLNGKDRIEGKNGDDELLGGGGRDILLGQNGNDDIKGGGGWDRIIGGSGDDTIEGGSGNDKSTGSSGADTFVFRAGSGTDTITDFEDGTDAIQIADHTGGLGTLTITDDGTDITIVHDGGTIILENASGATIDGADISFI